METFLILRQFRITTQRSPFLTQLHRNPGYTPDDGNVNDTSDPDISQGDDTGDTGDVVDDGTDTGDNSDSELDDSSSGDTGDDTVEVY